MDFPTHRSVADAREFIDRCAERWASGFEYTWVVTGSHDDRVIGAISCRVRGHAADFGYILNPGSWGRGFATEAGKAVVDWVANLAPVARVWATCDADNIASACVLEKLGLSREGVLRAWAIRPNISLEPRDACVYARVRRAA